MGRPSAAQTAQNRQRIVHVARAAFAELGYGGASVEEIAMRADLSRSVIHHHFSNKRVLWNEVVAQSNALVVGRALEMAESQHSLLGRLSALFPLPTEADAEACSAAAFLVTSVVDSRRHPELKGADGKAPEAFREVISWAVNDAINRGELDTDSDADHLVELLVTLVWGMGYGRACVGAGADRAAMVDMFDLLITNRLWHLREPLQPAWQDGGVPRPGDTPSIEALPAPGWGRISANLDEVAELADHQLVS